MADVLMQLQELGFGEYEARAYHALLQHNPVNGYELAKVSGVPRANIYLVLHKLEERGVVVRVEDGDSTRYLPVDPDEVLDEMAYHMTQTIASARQTLETLSHPAATDSVWNIQGYANLLSHARAVIKDARHELLVAIWPDEARALGGEVAAAEDRTVEITTLCLAACPQECGNCRGQVFRHKVVDTPDSHWLMVVPDDDAMIAGEIGAGGTVSTVRSRQRLLVNMTAWFIRYSIALGIMLQDLGDQVEANLAPPARAALDSVGPKESHGWLAYMRELLSGKGRSADLRSSG